MASSDALQARLELLADALTPVPQVPVGICTNMPAEGPRSGRVVVCGVLLSSGEAYALAGKLVRAADALERRLR
jgi:hypothetical protein